MISRKKTPQLQYLMRVAVAAREAGRNERAVQWAVARGLIPCHKTGCGTVLVDVRDIKAYEPPPPGPKPKGK